MQKMSGEQARTLYKMASRMDEYRAQMAKWIESDSSKGVPGKYDDILKKLMLVDGLTSSQGLSFTLPEEYYGEHSLRMNLDEKGNPTDWSMVG